MPDSTTRDWIVLIPAKRFDLAKSRLGDQARASRGEFARAFLHDTVTAALDVPEVVAVFIITGQIGLTWPDDRVTVLAEGPGSDINDAIQQGEERASRLNPHAGRVALAADLPALTGPALGGMLELAGQQRRSVVADCEGVGSTALTAIAGQRLHPAFGSGSYARHLASGAVALDTVDARLRRDVDLPEHLEDVQALGPGRATSALLATTVSLVQATIATFDNASGVGTLLLDDGVLLPFDSAAFQSSGLRHLRPGQRVRLQVVDGTVSGLHFP